MAIEHSNESEFIAYCTRCLAIDIRVEGNLEYCPHCFKRKNPSTIDFTTWERWEELYEQKYGHQLVEKKTPYDDISEVFYEEAEETITEIDAISKQMIVREKINLNLDRLKE